MVFLLLEGSTSPYLSLFGTMNSFVGCSLTSRNIKQWEELCSSPASGYHSGALAGTDAAWWPALLPLDAPFCLGLPPPERSVRGSSDNGLDAIVAGLTNLSLILVSPSSPSFSGMIWISSHIRLRCLPSSQLFGAWLCGHAVCCGGGYESTRFFFPMSISDETMHSSRACHNLLYIFDYVGNLRCPFTMQSSFFWLCWG